MWQLLIQTVLLHWLTSSRFLTKAQKASRLPNTLEMAVERFQAQESVARQIMGDEFVNFYTVSRRHELALWQEAVADW